MSGLYDTVEPAVIDDHLLKQCVEEQGPTGEAGRIAKKEGINLKDVLELRLDFKNILKIDNVWRCTNLTKLQLDNNIIEKIEGLAALVNLKWLDLSFNNIEVIEDLETLTKLEDLTLFNNRISTICNMDSLTKLHVFSIGNNKLHHLDNLLYLRKFKELNTLNLSGNPFCKEEQYYTYTIAHLTSLVYLDYRLIDRNKREEAIGLYPDSIDELMHDEEILARKVSEVLKLEEERAIHREAYVEDLDGPALFQSLFVEDAEASKLAQLPGMSNMLASFEENFTKICVSLFEYGLADSEKRKSEIQLFYAAMHEACETNRNDSIEHIQKFDKMKTKVLSELITVHDQGVLKGKLVDLADEITALWDKLMALEMQLVDQLEESIKEFERNLSDMVVTFVENVQEFINQLRELEMAHHEKLSEIATVTLEKLQKNELEEEMTEEVKMLLVDKDTVMNAVSSSHDAHTFRIDGKEDDIVTRIHGYVQLLMGTIHNDEIKRNRARVVEINNLLDHYREELETFESNMGV